MSSLPTGTVTFLFTDIEGSTKLWERSPQAMQRALARHDQILRDAVEERGGYIFKTAGTPSAAPSVPPRMPSRPHSSPRVRYYLKKAGPRRRVPCE
jgi:class 3 adenylate cyclase